MIPPAFLHGLCFPWMLLSQSGDVIDSRDGTLFKLNRAAMDAISIEHAKIAKPGWSRCPKGFAVYCRVLPVMDGARIVLHGLKVKGVSTVSGRSEFLSIKTDAAEIERYLNTVFSSFSDIEQYIRNILGRSVHEVRRINVDMQAATYDLMQLLAQVSLDTYAIGVRIANIKSLSEILSARTDFLDYFANPALALLPDKNIQVHNKFYKAMESLRFRAESKDLQLRRYGNTEAHIGGLRVFEVVPFILLENAIKYSPSGSTVDVNFLETPNEIKVTICNMGPEVETDEIPRIFDLGQRARNAAAAKVSGYGIGLYFARELVVRHHRGDIQFRQYGDVRNVGGVPYKMTEVTLTFPRTS